MIILAKIVFFIILLLYIEPIVYSFLMIFSHKSINYLRNRKKDPKNVGNGTFSVSVIIAAYNEEKKITSRLRNLEELYHSSALCNSMEVIIGSDGSTDQTVANCKMYKSNKAKGIDIKIIDNTKNQGRAFIHNASAKIATGELMLFTDAETIFSMVFLDQILACYAPDVGSVFGRISYSNIESSRNKLITKLYWKYEVALRIAKSYFGINVFGTGACVSFRTFLWQDLNVYEDIDYAQTTNTKMQGYKVVFCKDAVAYDLFSVDQKTFFKDRVRKTRKALYSLFFKAKEILPPTSYSRIFLLHEIYAHKISRHLSPLFLLILIMLSPAIFPLKVLIIIGITGLLCGGLCVALKNRLGRLLIDYCLVQFARLQGVFMLLFWGPQKSYKTIKKQ